jgi:peroxiredoxin Q/BCP
LNLVNHSTVEEGSVAPDFRLKSDDGKTYSLGEYRGKKRVVVYFYPEDDTPGCTKEACSFRDSLARLNKEDVQVLGISHNDLDAHSKFRTKYSLNFPLLSDTDNETSKKYGVFKMKNLYGREFLGIERSTFIIDKKGIVRKVYRKVRVDGHVDKILEDLNNV